MMGCIILLMETIALPLFLALSNPPLPWELLPILLLGIIGFAGVGTLFAAISVNTRTREVMLPSSFFR